jgi:uncharacterized membrane protein YkvA (DUF1232 family)
MTTANDHVTVLQRFVDGHRDAIHVVLRAFADEATPTPARRVLGGVLNYVLDLLDMFPDHYKGLGAADDAMLLRLGARQAITAGASDEQLRALGAEASEIEPLVGELLAPLETYVARLPERTVRGRTVDQILGDQVLLGVFQADVERQAAAHKPQQIDTSTSANWSMNELKMMIKHELKKAGIS